MSDACYCDYGDQPEVYHAQRHTARKPYRCSECHRPMAPGEKYERAAMLYDGSWEVMRTCARCLDARDYIDAHAPCFCWLHGSMLDDARGVVDEYGHVSEGFYIGAMKRILRAERGRASAKDNKP